MRSTTTSMSCLYLLVERGGFLDVVEFAVDADAGEAGLLPLGELLAILALAAADDGGEEVVAAAFGQGHDAVDHLADLLRLDRQAGGGGIRHADARPQQAHVIVDFGDRGDGRARVAAGGLLLDRDGGREAVDMLDIGLLHHLEELARIGRQRLDVAALALGIDGVEGEARLARARQAGDDRQALARDVDVDPLEVVLAGAADGNIFSIGSASFHLCSDYARARPRSTGGSQHGFLPRQIKRGAGLAGIRLQHFPSSPNGCETFIFDQG